MLSTGRCRLQWIATLVVLGALCVLPPGAEAQSAVYGGGPFYNGGTPVMNTLRASGFKTVVLWTIHVHSNGDLYFNDTLVVAGGSYVGNSAWPGQLATLKQAPTSVTRIEVGVGSAGVADWETIRDLINSQGTGANSILRRNFQALKSATGADAINDDDESGYDVNSTIAFANMAASLGYKFTLCPYTNSGFWATIKSSLGSLVDHAYLQCYAGGSGNVPSSWNSALGMKVDPGLWCRHGSGCASGDTPSSVQTRMSGWKSSAGITGGFMWLYDDMQACSGQGTTAQYAAAINNALGGGSGSGIVQLYQDCNFGGWVASFANTGSYTTAQIVSAGGRDNDASSIKIAGGYKVTLYANDNLGGKSIVLTGNDSCFVADNFNDGTSSMKIEAAGGSSGVTFYQNSNFGGAAGQVLAKGTYTLSQLQAKGVSNDWASSVKIPSGWTVILYQHDNFGGTSWTLTADTPDLTSLSPSANDQMSSCKIQ